MGRAREVGWMAAGLMIGAGACYCVYKLTIGREDSDNLEEEEEEEEEEEWDDSEDLDEEDPEMWFDFTTMSRPWKDDGDWTKPGAPGDNKNRNSGGGKANRGHLSKHRPFPYIHKTTSSAQSFIDLTKKPLIQVKVRSQPKDAGLYIISDHLASLSMLGNMVSTQDPTVKVKAICIMGGLNMSAEIEGQIKMSINRVYLDSVSHCCNSFLQQAGLNLLISMTVIHHMLAKSVLSLKFPLKSEGSRCATARVWKLLAGLPEKPALARDLLRAHLLLSFMPPFARKGNREIILDSLAP
ncbi:PREDICTED: protein ARMCX6 [Elephantulus edwardii]|uniref:protein ARMCX6 n=1 Tax=Elephantulus edwardii TaxID=28737 RepID=UPI0003F074F8|nr:PREDICTED: protein ARMCX6 [Elephantulus edwardii]